jgi:hypothetical protein
MLDEIMSAIAGNAIAKLISKVVPARTTGEFAAVPFDIIERRNRSLYFGLLSVSIVGFFLPFFFIPVKIEYALWVLGAVFGLPFSAMLIFTLAVLSLFGARRLRELMFYFEVKQKTNINVCYLFGSPMAVIGIVSFLVLVWR